MWQNPTSRDLCHIRMSLVSTERWFYNSCWQILKKSSVWGAFVVCFLTLLLLIGSELSLSSCFLPGILLHFSNTLKSISLWFFHLHVPFLHLIAFFGFPESSTLWTTLGRFWIWLKKVTQQHLFESVVRLWSPFLVIEQKWKTPKKFSFYLKNISWIYLLFPILFSQ